MRASLTNILKRLYHRIFDTKVIVNVEVIPRNFKRFKEKRDPIPIEIKGYELDCDYGKVIDIGHSRGVTISPNWLDAEIVEKKWFVDEKGEKGILLTKPKEEEIAT